MAFKKINKDSNLEKIIDQIKEQITSGSLKPGDKLPPERELSKLLGVSRNSIREAIQALSYSGYLDVVQGKGAFVRESALRYDKVYRFFTSIPEFSLDSLMETRIMLESEFAKLAAARASREDIAKIKRCLKEVEEAENIEEFVIKDLDFHFAIAEATHNELMSTLMKIFGAMLHEETSKIVKFAQKIRERVTFEIKEVVKAIENNDREQAKKRMIKHLEIVDDSRKIHDKEIR